MTFSAASTSYFLIPIYTIIVLSVLYFKIIPHEEKALREKYGEEYIDYCKKVRKIIPHIRNPLQDCPGRCDLELGLKNDAQAIAMHVFLIGMLITLPWWYAIIPG